MDLGELFMRSNKEEPYANMGKTEEKILSLLKKDHKKSKLKLKTEPSRDISHLRDKLKKPLKKVFQALPTDLPSLKSLAKTSTPKAIKISIPVSPSSPLPYREKLHLDPLSPQATPKTPQSKASSRQLFSLSPTPIIEKFPSIEKDINSPNNIQEIKNLYKWFNTMKNQCEDEESNELVYSICARELIKQITGNSTLRGKVLREIIKDQPFVFGKKYSNLLAEFEEYKNEQKLRIRQLKNEQKDGFCSRQIEVDRMKKEIVEKNYRAKKLENAVEDYRKTTAQIERKLFYNDDLWKNRLIMITDEVDELKKKLADEESLIVDFELKRINSKDEVSYENNVQIGNVMLGKKNDDEVMIEKNIKGEVMIDKEIKEKFNELGRIEEEKGESKDMIGIEDCWCDDEMGNEVVSEGEIFKDEEKMNELVEEENKENVLGKVEESKKGGNEIFIENLEKLEVEELDKVKKNKQTKNICEEVAENLEKPNFSESKNDEKLLTLKDKVNIFSLNNTENQKNPYHNTSDPSSKIIQDNQKILKPIKIPNTTTQSILPKPTPHTSLKKILNLEPSPNPSPTIKTPQNVSFSYTNDKIFEVPSIDEESIQILNPNSSKPHQSQEIQTENFLFEKYLNKLKTIEEHINKANTEEIKHICQSPKNLFIDNNLKSNQQPIRKQEKKLSVKKSQKKFQRSFTVKQSQNNEDVVMNKIINNEEIACKENTKDSEEGKEEVLAFINSLSFLTSKIVQKKQEISSLDKEITEKAKVLAAINKKKNHLKKKGQKNIDASRRLTLQKSEKQAFEDRKRLDKQNTSLSPRIKKMGTETIINDNDLSPWDEGYEIGYDDGKIHGFLKAINKINDSKKTPYKEKNNYDNIGLQTIKRIQDKPRNSTKNIDPYTISATKNKSRKTITSPAFVENSYASISQNKN